ncbi:MAG: TerB family tellurite resistance protein, partial [Taibaiella sp.]|nr:TerB family tellurite resistance protein [Taibaiella sp.]
IAHIDGEFVQQEHELYQAMLSRMSFDEHSQADYQRILASESNVLQAVNQLDDPILSQTLLDALILMAVCDGKLADEERAFLQNVATQLQVEIDLAIIEEQTREYRTTINKGFVQKSKDVAKNFVGRVKNAAQATGSKVKNTVDTVSNHHSQSVSQDADDGT